MSTKQQELLISQTNADAADKSKSTTSGKLFEMEDIIGTPFKIIGEEINGYCLILGNHRLTEFMPYKYDVEKALQENMWQIITSLIIIVSKQIQEENK